MAIIARHTNSDSKQTLDRLFTATELKKVLSSYKKHTNIGAVSKMKKSQLIDVLHKLEFKLNAFDKGEHQIYTFDLSSIEQDEENKHEIKRPLKKPETKTKTKPASKPASKPTQDSIYRGMLKFIEDNKDKLEKIPFGTRQNMNKPFKNWYQFYINAAQVDLGSETDTKAGLKSAKDWKELIMKKIAEADDAMDFSGDQKRGKFVLHDPIGGQSGRIGDVKQEELDKEKKFQDMRNARKLKELNEFFDNENASYSKSKNITSKKILEDYYIILKGLYTGEKNKPAIMIKVEEKLGLRKKIKPASKPKTKKLLTSDDLFKQREAEEKKMKEENEVFQKKKQEKIAKDKMDKYKEEQKQLKEKFENQARLRYETDKRRFKDFSKKKLESINTKKEIEEYFRDFRDLKFDILGYSRAGQKRINLKNREDWSKDVRNFYEKDNKTGQKKIEEMIELYNNHLNQISKKAKALFKKK